MRNGLFTARRIRPPEKVRERIAQGDFQGPDKKAFWVYLDEHSEPVGMVCLHELTDDAMA
jgi:hypothetical protein